MQAFFLVIHFSCICPSLFLIISSVCNNFTANLLHPPRQTASALCGFVSRTDFAIVEHIFFSYRNRRKVRHYDICPRKHSHLTPFRMNRSKRRRRRQQHMRKLQALKCQIKQRVLQPPSSFLGIRVILMLNIRSDSYHLRIQIFQKQKILYQIINCLKR